MTLRHDGGRMDVDCALVAGDSAHTVPPTGAQGMNLPIADATELAESLVAHFHRGDGAPPAAYSDTRLPDIWRNVHPGPTTAGPTTGHDG